MKHILLTLVVIASLGILLITDWDQLNIGILAIVPILFAGWDLLTSGTIHPARKTISKRNFAILCSLHLLPVVLGIGILLYSQFASPYGENDLLDTFLVRAVYLSCYIFPFLAIFTTLRYTQHTTLLAVFNYLTIPASLLLIAGSIAFAACSSKVEVMALVLLILGAVFMVVPWIVNILHWIFPNAQAWKNRYFPTKILSAIYAIILLDYLILCAFA